MEDISSVEIQYATSKVIHGKWLVGCESSSKFVVHDLDSNTGLHSAGSVGIRFLDPFVGGRSVVSTSGLLMHVVFCTTMDEFVPWSASSFTLTSSVRAFHVHVLNRLGSFSSSVWAILSITPSP
jgi:hypothetical protein